jgi:hypothetical protein
VTGGVLHISLLSFFFIAGSRRLRNVVPTVIFVVFVISVSKECNQLSVCEPSERNGIAEWEKMETGFCVMTEACGTCVVDFRTVCCIIIDAVAVQWNVC